MIKSYKGKTPQIAENVFLGEGSIIIGNVIIKEGASIWYNTVLRGDLSKIYVGKNSNIQENSSVHLDTGVPALIGDNVTIGHGAIIHGCEIKDNCLIGMGAKLLNNSVIGKNTIVGAGALVTEGTEIPENSLVLGMPAKVVRSLSEEEIEGIQESAEHYCQLAAEHKKIYN